MESIEKVLLSLAAVLFVCAGPACKDGPSGPAQDSPIIEIVFPTAGSYDRDGDGLVDIEVVFADSGAGIKEESITVRSDRALGPAGTGGTDLMAAFVVVEMDSLHLRLEETTDAILPSGPVVLTIEVEDQRGNRGEEQITVNLPAGEFHTKLSIDTQGAVLPIVLEPVGIEMIPDGTVGFLLLRDSPAVVPFDPHTLVVGPWLPTGSVGDHLDGVFDPTTDRLYIVNGLDGRLTVIDPRALQAGPPIVISGRGTGIERGASGDLYISLSAVKASVSVVDPVMREEIRLLQTDVEDPLNPGQEAFIAKPTVTPEEDLLYVPLKVTPGGLLVLDIDTGELIDHLDFNPLENTRGFAIDSALDGFGSRLYLTDFDALTEFDLHEETILRRIETGKPQDLRLRFVALSPSSARAFVTVAASIVGRAENWLVDLDGFTILNRFTEPVSQPFGDENVVFRPDGQLVFVASGDKIAVYLNRE